MSPTFIYLSVELLEVGPVEVLLQLSGQTHVALQQQAGLILRLEQVQP